MLVYVFVGGTVVALIIFKVKKDIIIGFKVVFSVAIIGILELIIGVGVAIIIIIIMRYLLRVCLLISLFSFAERVFASFTF
jgi:hypothetical protein